MSENTNILKGFLIMLFYVMASVGIVLLLSPLIKMLANFLTSLTWYQAGIGFSVIGLVGLYILYKTGAMSK